MAGGRGKELDCLPPPTATGPGTPLSQRLCPDFPREAPHPLQAGGPLLPPPPVPLEEAGGAALLRGAAEPARGVGRGAHQVAVTGPKGRARDRRDGQAGGRPRGGLGALPAQGVVLVRVPQAGALQLAGQEGGGALVPSQVALQPRGAAGPVAPSCGGPGSSGGRPGVLRACPRGPGAEPTLPSCQAGQPAGLAPHRRAHCCLACEAAPASEIQLTLFPFRAPDSPGCWTR